MPTYVVAGSKFVRLISSETDHKTSIFALPNFGWQKPCAEAGEGHYIYCQDNEDNGQRGACPSSSQTNPTTSHPRHSENSVMFGGPRRLACIRL